MTTSIRKLLEQPLKPQQGDNRQRHLQLEIVLGQSIVIPEHFEDAITFHIMTNPCNLKLKADAEDYYVDETVKKSLVRHPTSNMPFKSNPTLENELAKVAEELRARIDNTLTITELLQHIKHCEDARQNRLKTQLQHQSPADCGALLAFHSRDILKHYTCPGFQVPEDLLSRLTNIIMTLPVIVDGLVMDFFELLAVQPPRKIPSIEESARDASLDELKLQAVQRATANYEKHLHELELRVSLFKSNAPESSNAGCKLAKIPELIAIETQRYHKRIEIISAATTMADIGDYYLQEYLHPITDKPIIQFEVDYKRLAAINNFLAKARSFPLLVPIFDKIAEHDTLLKLTHANFENKTFMEVLAANNVPDEKIPDNLLVSIEPGSAYTLVATHPVVIDGTYPTDFVALVTWWEANQWGINPATDEPIHSIVYLDELRKATQDFVVSTIAPQPAETSTMPSRFLKNNLFAKPAKKIQDLFHNSLIALKH